VRPIAADFGSERCVKVSQRGKCIINANTITLKGLSSLSHDRVSTFNFLTQCFPPACVHYADDLLLDNFRLRRITFRQKRLSQLNGPRQTLSGLIQLTSFILVLVVVVVLPSPETKGRPVTYIGHPKTSTCITSASIR